MLRSVTLLLTIFFSAIYASTDFNTRHSLWTNLISTCPHKPWLIGGNFNKVLRASEKFGGNSINRNRVNLFWNCINHYGLNDLGFKGSKFTWTNRNSRNLILERLDRCLANNDWLHIFSDATVTHLPRTHSDHCPILVNLQRLPSKPKKPFRVESMWCSHPSFVQVIQESFSSNVPLTDAIALFQDQAKV